MKGKTKLAARSLAVVIAIIYIYVPVCAAEPNPSDLAQANKFLADLPGACSSSYKYISPDGTVNIRIKCDRNGKKIDGLIAIKNGVVTDIK